MRQADSAAAVQLLQQLIREGCVNDGSDASGGEIRSARVLEQFFAGTPVETRVFESLPGRASLVARVAGTDPQAPKLGLLGHLDVVPAEFERWSRDPFAGEVVDDEVWGRGAVDMLYLVSIFATVLREVAEAAAAGRPPRGDVVLMAVADEEAGSERGLKWLMREQPEAVKVTEVLGESGGMRIGSHVAIEVGEKGSAGRKIIVRGEPGHASVPYGARNAITRAAEVVALLSAAAPPVRLGPVWGEFVEARVSDPELAGRLQNAEQLDAALPALGAEAGYAHALSRVTISPTRLNAGVAHNVVPGRAEIALDIRTLPGVGDDEVDQLLAEVLAPVSEFTEVQHMLGWPATLSPAETPLFAAIEQGVHAASGQPTVPIIAAGGSDCRMFRELGVPAYGFGVLAPDWSYAKYRSRIHGHDERIDLESVELTLTALRHIVAARVGDAGAVFSGLKRI